MSKPPKATRHNNSRKLSTLLSLRAILNLTFSNETPCMTNWGFLNRDLALSAQFLRLKNEQGLVPKIVKRGENRKKNRPVQVCIPAMLSTRKFYRQRQTM